MEACPTGWHLPSKEEWEDLFEAVGGQSTAGAKLKSQTGWTPFEGINNEDTFGFSALPAGFRNNGGIYYYAGNDAFFWSSTDDNGDIAYDVFLYYDGEKASLSDLFKYYGFSVRCLKD